MSYNQRETPILAELCTRLVEDVYGQLAGRVFSVFARHGRQTLAAVARASYLNGRQIKYGLVILLQQHLVFHSAADAPVTYYEIDWQHAYALVRFGKITKFAEDRFGKKAANVLSNLLTSGHTRVADLKDAYFPQETDSEDDDESDDDVPNGTGLKRKRDNCTQVNGTAKTNGLANGTTTKLETGENGLVNGDDQKPKLNGITNGDKKKDSKHAATNVDEGDITSVDDFYNILLDLMEQGWIITVHETQYLSPGDLHHMMEQEAIDEDNAGNLPTGPKDKDRILRSTLRRKRRERDSWQAIPKFWQKRRAEEPDYNNPAKRLKVNGGNQWVGTAGSTSSASTTPEDNLVIRVNPEKIAVAMRTEQLVHLVEQRIGHVTAHIYRVMLQKIETSIPRCFEEWPDPPVPNAEEGDDTEEFLLLVTARDVAKRLGRDFDVCEGLDPNTVVSVTKRGGVSKSHKLTQPIDPSKLSLDHKTELVNSHIQLLANDPFHFVTWHARSGGGQYQIEFDEIAKQVIQHEIENTLAARKGTLGVKLIRALRKKGKLDERQTCNAMMMSASDIRGIIDDLVVQGFVQTQEVPKVERREAKHSLHLIWYDRQRAREKLLHDTYKGMVRIMQRIAFEREKVQPLLSKAERSDVKGNEEKWLNKGELDALKKWKYVQEKLLLQLFREDELVATLRDFHGALISV